MARSRSRGGSEGSNRSGGWLSIGHEKHGGAESRCGCVDVFHGYSELVKKRDLACRMRVKPHPCLPGPSVVTAPTCKLPYLRRCLRQPSHSPRVVLPHCLHRWAVSFEARDGVSNELRGRSGGAWLRDEGLDTSVPDLATSVKIRPSKPTGCLCLIALRFSCPVTVVA